MSATTATITDSAAPADASRDGGWDWWLLSTSLVLAALGLLLILSASSDMADSRYGDALRFVTRQGLGMLVGMVGAVVALTVPWGWYRGRPMWALAGLVLVSLLLVWSPLGVGANGARRWLDLGLLNVQPSEFAKIAVILVGANYLAHNAHRIDDILGVVLPLCMMVAVPTVLVLLEPDFGSMVILVGLLGYQLIIAGLPKKWIAGGLGLGGAGLGLLAVAEPYRLRRLTSFMHPFEDMEGDGYQVIQGWIAMGTGGVAGRGLGGGAAQSGFLPEAHTDFIAAVMAEEAGAIGWVAMVALYGILLWRGTVIANRASSLYGTLLAGGVTTLLMAQTVVNLGVIVGWVPPKGLVLPFLSYGASAVMIHVVCVALLLRVGLESAGGEGRR